MPENFSGANVVTGCIYTVISAHPLTLGFSQKTEHAATGPKAVSSLQNSFVVFLEIGGGNDFLGNIFIFDTKATDMVAHSMQTTF